MIGGFIGKSIGGTVSVETIVDAIGSATGLGAATATGAGIRVSSASAAGLGAANGAGGKVAGVTASASGLGAANATSLQVIARAGAASGSGQASGAGSSFTLSYLRPDGDSANANWTDQAGGAVNIYQAIDEPSANDADYVQSPSRESASADLTVRLYQGTTLIAQWSHANVGETFTDAEQTLTAPQADAITNFANLFVELDDGVDVYRFGLGDPAGLTAPPITVKYRYKKLAA